MRNRTKLRTLILAAGLLIAPEAAMGHAGHGVVVVLSQDLAPYRAAVESFRSESGMQVAVLDLKGDVAEGTWILREIRRLKPDAVVTIGSLATELLGPQILDIPVVYCMTMAVSEALLSAGNVTGVSLSVDPEQQFRALKLALPAIRSVGVIFDPAHSARLIAEAGRKAQLVGLQLVTRAVSRANEVPDAVRVLAGQADAIWLIPDSTCFTRESFEFVLKLSLNQRIPLLVFSEAYVKAGALLSLSPDYAEIGRQAARMVRRIGTGGAARASPPEAPEHPRLVINLRTAGTLNLALSSASLQAADRIVE